MLKHLLYSKFLRQTLCSHYLLWKRTMKCLKWCFILKMCDLSLLAFSIHPAAVETGKKEREKRKTNVLLWKSSPDCCPLKAWIFVELIPFLKFTYRVWGCFKFISILQYCGSVNFLIFNVYIAFALLCLSCPNMLKKKSSMHF